MIVSGICILAFAGSSETVDAKNKMLKNSEQSYSATDGSCDTETENYHSSLDAAHDRMLEERRDFQKKLKQKKLEEHKDLQQKILVAFTASLGAVSSFDFYIIVLPC